MKDAGGICYKSAGRGGVPVICLHGIGGDANSFLPQLAGLSDERRIISWCMPGYSGSEALETMTFAGLSVALGRFMDALGMASAHIMGQSIGGMIALDFALRQPQRVASLILIATTPAFGGRDDSFRDRFIAARLKPLDDGATMAELAGRFVPEIMGAGANKETIAHAAASMARVCEATYRQVIGCLVTFDRRDDLDRIACPCCLIAGDEDQNAPAHTMAKMAGRLAGAEYHEIAGAGHLVNLEAPGEVNAIIRQFLNNRG